MSAMFTRHAELGNIRYSLIFITARVAKKILLFIQNIFPFLIG